MKLKIKIPTTTKKIFIVGKLRLPVTQRIFILGLISILLVLNILNIGVLKFQPVQAERCNWADITCIPYIKERSSSIVEEAWGAAGTMAYQAAAEWMRANNGIGQYLDKTQKRYLRPYFGGLVDRVVVIYNAKLMDEWVHAGFKTEIGLGDSAAQTYCERIYIDDKYKSIDSDQLTRLAHELIHSRQCHLLGGADEFGYHYFREFKRAGQSYEDNKLEREANKFEIRFAGWLSNQLANSQATLGQG